MRKRTISLIVICFLLLALGFTTYRVGAGKNKTPIWTTASQDIITLYNRLYTLDESSRRQLFSELNGSTKSKLWNYHFDIYVNTHSLSDAQKSFVQDMRIVMGPDWEVSKGTIRRLDPFLRQTAIKLFGGKAGELLTRLAVPPNQTSQVTKPVEFKVVNASLDLTKPTGENAAAACDWCNCSIVSDWCTGGQICSCFRHCWTIPLGCGTAGVFECDGRCRHPQTENCPDCEF